MLKELDRAELTCDLLERGLKRGDIGTIVHVHKESGYIMEFTTLIGKTIAVVPVFADQVRPVGPRDIDDL